MPAYAQPILWIAAFFNLGAAAALALPASIGALLGLPTEVPVLYAGMVSVFVLLFGASYAWMAMQPAIVKPLLGFAAIGKTSMFVLALVFWLRGEVTGMLMLVACGDLAFAALFFHWLRKPG